MSKLYPLKFRPIIKDKIWGGEKLRTVLNKKEAGDKAGESWEISCYENDISIISNGFLKGNNLEELIEIYMGDLVGDKIFEKFGMIFPLLIKFIHAADILSIQVHPGDEVAIPKHSSFGKTEMWYIVDSDPGSTIISGFNREMDKQIYVKHLRDGKIEEIMNYEKTHPGDVFFIPAGRVHAIGAGNLLVEIQQTSDITYRIFDFNRKDDQGNTRELHTDDALEVIDFKKHPSYREDFKTAKNKAVNVVDCPYFTTNLMSFDKPVEKDYNLIDSFIIYICTEGSLTIKSGSESIVPLTKGETVLIPALLKNIEIVPNGECNLIEVYVK